jgi:heptosyltransferase-3
MAHDVARTTAMRLMFSKPKLIGDALLLTPTLMAVRTTYPQAEIWVLVRRGSEGILAGCAAIDRIATIAAAPVGEERRLSDWLSDIRLIRQLRRRSFDIWFELGDGHRARWFSLFCGAKRIYATKPRSALGSFWRWWFDGISDFDWKGRHRVAKDYYSVSQFLPLPDQDPPPLVFERARTDSWVPGAALEDFAVIHPGTRDRGKHWPLDRWVTVGEFLLSRFDKIVISVGPLAPERDEAAWLAQQLGPRAISMDGKTDLPQLAGLLYRARLFVGLDTAAMHLAAACGTPIVALFAPSMESEWRPWRVAHRVVAPAQGQPAEAMPDGGTLRRMDDIATADVIAACQDLLRAPQRAAEGG